MSGISGFVSRVAKEPPFRLLARAALSKMNVSLETRSTWGLSPRPNYLLCLYTAAKQAMQQGVAEISAIEFGVAGGDGLVALQSEAEAVERGTGVRIKVYGFDNGGGLPVLIGDHRDHPDAWLPGDFPMDIPRLKSRLKERTTLILGNVKETVPSFFEKFKAPPIGFISVDVDLYSSTRDALQILGLADKKMLWHVPMYFDDVSDIFNHRFAGELLAIDEFNESHSGVKIDRWHGVRAGRPFPEHAYLDRLYVAHDLDSISVANLKRDTEMLPLKV